MVRLRHQGGAPALWQIRWKNYCAIRSLPGRRDCTTGSGWRRNSPVRQVNGSALTMPHDLLAV